MKQVLLSVLAVVLVVLPTGCGAGPETTQSAPTAYIDAISPSSPTEEDIITFLGHGTDVDGTVVGYRWRSSIDGDLSALPSFETQLSSGNHVISLEVQDNHGNWSDEVSKSITVAVAAQEPTPTPQPEDPPMVNSFTVTPDEVSEGGTATLAWDVAGAESLAIDNGVGAVSNSGNTVVMPADTTIYTLTAANSAGSVEVSVVVLVTPAPSPDVDKPDLVVTSITRDGSTVKYTIKNQGTADAGPSNSRLFIDGVEKAAHSIAGLAAGASRTESFNFLYECSGMSDVLLVQVDKDSMVDETNEANNSFSTTWYCILVLPDPEIVIPPIVLQPDLTVTDIWVSANRIHYRIENIGMAASAPSTSRLSVDYTIVWSDTLVPSLAAGESLDRYFMYQFKCMVPTKKQVSVRVDAEDTNNESNELNNSMTVSLWCS